MRKANFFLQWGGFCDGKSPGAAGKFLPLPQGRIIYLTLNRETSLIKECHRGFAGNLIDLVYRLFFIVF